MQITHSCPKCKDSTNYLSIEIDEGFFTGKSVQCSNGHDFFFISKSPRFQYLLQIGIESYLKGFYFECFHSIYAAYEAYKKEFVAAHFFNETNNIESSKEMLKKLDRSERLEGAYVSSFISLSNGVTPNFLPDSIVKLRNKVVHKGILPNQETCLKTGNAIFKLIGEGNLLITQRFKDNIDIFPITQVFEDEFTKSILQNKGFETEINTPNDFNNREFIEHTMALNILSTNVVIENKEITDHMFTDQINNGIFLIS